MSNISDHDIQILRDEKTDLHLNAVKMAPIHPESRAGKSGAELAASLLLTIDRAVL
jgi:hypothetical protein